MRVLALAIDFADYMYDTLPREQWALARAVAARGGELRFVGPGFDYPSPDVSTIVEGLRAEGWEPDLVLCFLSESDLLGPLPEVVQRQFALEGARRRFPVGLEKLQDLPKAIWINDCWHLDASEWERALLGNGFRDVIATYCPPFLRESDFRTFYDDEVRRQVRFHPLPRGIDPERFRFGEGERPVDVTLLGAMGPFYPLRGRFHEALSAQSDLQYVHRPHPGYGFAPGEGLVGDAYAAALARSRVFVSCTGRYNIPFIKIGEVLASGAVLMCDRPCGAEELGLVDEQSYVEVDEVSFLPKLRRILADDGERARIAAAGRETFEQHFRSDERAERFADLLEAIVEDRSHPHPAPGPAPRPARRPARAARPSPLRRLRAAAGALLRGNPEPEALWAPTRGGSRLDWCRVREFRHILDVCRIETREELRLVERYGLDAQPGPPPVLTHYAELVQARPKALARLAERLEARVLVEVGTARGLQSIFWSRALESRGVEGRVFTCDIDGHDEPIYRTPLSAEHRWTRRELWRQEPSSGRLRFVEGDSSMLAATLGEELAEGKTVDLLYVDGEHSHAAVCADVQQLSPFLGPSSVVVFGDCDPRFPGVEEAVNEIAAGREAELRVLGFWPSAHTVVLMGCPIALASLGERARTAPRNGGPA